jgi:hypothetical protein
MSSEDECRKLAAELRGHVPDDIVDLYESYLNEVEEQLALEELFDALQERDVKISAEAATQLWRLARSWGITRFTESEVAALIG